MKLTLARLVSAIAACIFFLVAPGSPAPAQAKPCKLVTMADNTQVRFCKDATGRWAQDSTETTQGSVVAPGAIGHSTAGFPGHAEVAYRGTFSMTISTPRGYDPSRDRANGDLGQAIKGSGHRLSGEMIINLTIEGSEVTARVTGTGLTALPMRGSVQNGECRLQSIVVEFPITYEGQCGPQRFVGRTYGRSLKDGVSQDGQFDVATVQLVDLDQRDRQEASERAERDRQQAAAQAERERLQAADQAERNRQAALAEAQRQQQVAAANSRYEALPKAGPALTRRLEGYVHQDSLGWAFYKFDPGSVRDVKIVEGSVKSGNYVMEGDYTYNRGRNGWVKVAMHGNQFNCIEFWDTMFGCRPLRAPGQGWATLGGPGNGSAGSGAANSDSGLTDEQRANLQESLIQSHAPVNQPDP